MKNFKRTFAGLMAMTMTMGTMGAIASAQEGGSTGAGSVEGIVAKDVFSVVLPAAPANADQFNIILDPQKLITDTNGQAYGGTAASNPFSNSTLFFKNAGVTAAAKNGYTALTEKWEVYIYNSAASDFESTAYNFDSGVTSFDSKADALAAISDDVTNSGDFDDVLNALGITDKTDVATAEGTAFVIKQFAKDDYQELTSATATTGTKPARCDGKWYEVTDGKITTDDGTILKVAGEAYTAASDGSATYSDTSDAIEVKNLSSIDVELKVTGTVTNATGIDFVSDELNNDGTVKTVVNPAADKAEIKLTLIGVDKDGNEDQKIDFVKNSAGAAAALEFTLDAVPSTEFETKHVAKKEAVAASGTTPAQPEVPAHYEYVLKTDAQGNPADPTKVTSYKFKLKGAASTNSDGKAWKDLTSAAPSIALTWSIEDPTGGSTSANAAPNSEAVTVAKAANGDIVLSYDPGKGDLGAVSDATTKHIVKIERMKAGITVYSDYVGAYTLDEDEKTITIPAASAVNFKPGSKFKITFSDPSSTTKEYTIQ